MKIKELFLLPKGKLTIVHGAGGCGKTIGMQLDCLSKLTKYKKILYFSNEVPQKIINKRFSYWFKNPITSVSIVDIVPMFVETIKVIVDDVKPDLVYVDYAALAVTRKHFNGINRFEDELIYKLQILVNISKEYDIPVVTATQQNKEYAYTNDINLVYNQLNFFNEKLGEHNLYLYFLERNHFVSGGINKETDQCDILLYENKKFKKVETFNVVKPFVKIEEAKIWKN